MFASFLLSGSSAAERLHQLRSKNVHRHWAEFCIESARPEWVSEVAPAIERMRARLAAVNLENSIKRAARFGFHPAMVADLPDLEFALNDLDLSAPKVLWIAGSQAALQLPAVGIVGSRQCTPYGTEVTRALVSTLPQDFAIVSGGALGIDATAHRAAVDCGVPTISYLAGGADKLYPTANMPLFEQILSKGGALVAECAPGTPPGRWRFLQRNRLIAAHSKVLVVSECGYRSGARNTARIAAELGRPVFAAPGPITSSASLGCNLMIEHGTAFCLSDVERPLDLLLGRESRQQSRFGRPDGETRVLDDLETEPQTAKEIAMRSGITLREVHRVLEALEERNEVRKRGDKWLKA